MKNEIVKIEDTEDYKCFMIINESRKLTIEYWSANFKATNPIDRAMEGYGCSHALICSPFDKDENDSPEIYNHHIKDIETEEFYGLLNAFKFIIDAETMFIIPDIDEDHPQLTKDI
jgi:hypothetical protein